MHNKCTRAIAGNTTDQVNYINTVGLGNMPPVYTDTPLALLPTPKFETGKVSANNYGTYRSLYLIAIH